MTMTMMMTTARAKKSTHITPLLKKPSLIAFLLKKE